MPEPTTPDAAEITAGPSSDAAATASAAAPAPFTPPQFDALPAPGAPAPLELLDDVELEVTVELGRAEMFIEDVLRLGVGSVVELNKLAGDPVDVYVNAQLVARGEVLVLNDSFCVRINDLVNPALDVDEAK